MKQTLVLLALVVLLGLVAVAPALAGEIAGEWSDPQQIDDDEIVDAEFTEDN